MVGEIRCAAPEEARALVGTYQWLFTAPGAQPPEWDPDRACATLRELTESPDTEVLVAELDGEVIGLCTVYLDIRSVRFGQRAWVEDLSSHPSDGRSGSGSACSTRPRTGRAPGERPTSSSTPPPPEPTPTASMSESDPAGDRCISPGRSERAHNLTVRRVRAARPRSPGTPSPCSSAASPARPARMALIRA